MLRGTRAMSLHARKFETLCHWMGVWGLGVKFDTVTLMLRPGQHSSSSCRHVCAMLSTSASVFPGRGRGLPQRVVDAETHGGKG